DSNGMYVYNDKPFSVSAKHSQCTVEKKVSIKGLNEFAPEIGVSKSGVDSKKSTFTYRITMDVPKYVSPVSDFTMQLEDQLPNGITIVPNTIKFTGIYIGNNGAEETTLTIPESYITKETNKITVNLARSYNTLQNYTKVVMEYDAHLNEHFDDETDLYYVDKNKNTATYTYSKYPYGGNYQDIDTQTSSANVYTYTMTIEKHDKIEPNKKLSGAEFTLYREKTNADNGATIEHNGKTLVAIQTGLITDENGQHVLNGLANGDYYLQETKAPTGYVLDNTIQGPFSISLKVNADVKVTVTNTEGLFNLPETGSTGKLIYSLAGLLLASIATICLIVVYKKGKKG
ncbi:MAG: SpaH/EbpB family LPXTG-anchored major pilin, partial [Floccifex sp.]